jgi:DNA-binding LytR/AlgR family response regulator
MELARLIPSETRIIFTTAYKQYAIDGYKVSAFDYLLKPVSFESFQATVERAAQLFFSKKQEETTHSDRFIFVKSDYKLIRVSLDDILYIEGLKDYVRLKLINGNRIMSLISMKRMEELLPKNEFMRTHRSYIVHMTLVDTIEKQRILMRDEVIPISDNYKEDIMRFAELHTLT